MRRCLILTLLIAGFLLPNLPVATAADTHRLIVTLKKERAVKRLENRYQVNVLAQVGSEPVFLIEVDDKYRKKLEKDKRVVEVEQDQLISLDQYPEQQGEEDDGYVQLEQSVMSLFGDFGWEDFYGTQVLKDYMDQEPLHMIDADDVHDLSTGAGTKIAFIDTGVDFDHPALGPWVEPGVDLLGTGSASEWSGLDQSVMSLFQVGVQEIASGVSLDQSVMSLFWESIQIFLDQSVMSLFGNGAGEEEVVPFRPMFGHGTLVAGILHAVAPEAVLVPIRTFDVSGHSSLFLATAAIYAAVDLDVDVINMSFSIGEDSETFQRALEHAWSNGVVLVASVGNDSRDAEDVYPASYPFVIGVAATEKKDPYLAAFSNYGNTVNVVAPGQGIVSTYPGGLYAIASGTSFSSPLVSGGVALLMSVGNRGDLAAQKIVFTADSIDDDNPEFRGMLGWGQMNLESALDPAKAEELIRAAEASGGN